MSKKTKRKSIEEDVQQRHVIAMGSMNGNITIYDVASAKVNKVLENGHSAPITALTWSALTGLFTVADDHQIVEWQVQESGIKCKWKCGKTKVTALAILPEGTSILSADRIIKWWDLSTKRLITSFSGHASQVTFLRPIKFDSGASYFISGASGDGYLSVWSLNEVCLCMKFK